MVKTWSQHGIEMVLKVVTTKTSAVDHDDSIFQIIEFWFSEYKVRPNMVQP